MKTLLKSWLLAALVISGLSGLLYAAVQQDLRLSADDPQIQLSQDTASKLSAGQSVQGVLPTDQIDLASSLAPYIIIFGASGKPIAGSATLHGKLPEIPSGIFDAVRKNGEDRLTWQPEPGVRSSIVVNQIKGSAPGFVMAGRSLSETEKRIDGIGKIVFLGWLGLLILTLLALALLLRSSIFPGRRKKNVTAQV